MPHNRIKSHLPASERLDQSQLRDRLLAAEQEAAKWRSKAETATGDADFYRRELMAAQQRFTAALANGHKFGVSWKWLAVWCYGALLIGLVVGFSF